VYASVADLRAEGVSESQATDERLEALLQEAGDTIDHAAGWFFEPRERAYRLDGRGTASIEPPVPPIQLDLLAVGGAALSLDPDDLVIVGAPVQPGFAAPRITLRHGRFPRGQGNVELEGLFGYSEDDGTPEGRVPREIRRACMLMVMRWLLSLADGGSDNASQFWRVVGMRTVDQSVSFASPGPAGPYTGDPELDRILHRYRRPMGLGAA